ncbi:hypothetical protein [Bradyrhizobium sp. BR 10261]|uniref:hypothetical protein n=1 Tax=Bradyrhizobium sp. BR 10261 TaxID=2749992 RepID=UPI001C64CCD2|nr:hypothetical protein [Bradyrhizobium sp. BR 10261]MBW7967242.1 hypothetical protein [Bradyrhizobium sp. BR 10261]
MKLVKTSVIACALSALLAGPVLAQGMSSDSKLRGGAQGKTTQGGVAGNSEEELEAQSGGASQTGMKPARSTKSTVGTTGSAAHKSATDGSAAGGATTNGKRY